MHENLYSTENIMMLDDNAFIFKAIIWFQGHGPVFSANTGHLLSSAGRERCPDRSHEGRHQAQPHADAGGESHMKQEKKFIS